MTIIYPNPIYSFNFEPFVLLKKDNELVIIGKRTEPDFHPPYIASLHLVVKDTLLYPMVYEFKQEPKKYDKILLASLGQKFKLKSFMSINGGFYEEEVWEVVDGTLVFEKIKALKIFKEVSR